MHKTVHRELPFDIISLYPKKELREFLLLSMVKPGWNKKLQNEKTRIDWLKQWMDSPDDTGHNSAPRNDHSYKIRKEGGRFKLVFGGSKQEQATVVARLKYDARDVYEWMVEEEPRVSALELSICMHWVVDMTTPSHACADCDQKVHGEMEKDFETFYGKEWPSLRDQVVFKGRQNIVKDVYRWGKGFIEGHYDRNIALVDAYKQKKTILKDLDAAKLGKDVLLDIGQNVADMLTFLDKRIEYDRAYAMLKKQMTPEG